MPDDPRFAALDAAGIEPHEWKPGQMRNRRTVCIDCLGYETADQHDPDLIRARRVPP